MNTCVLVLLFNELVINNKRINLLFFCVPGDRTEGTRNFLFRREYKNVITTLSSVCLTWRGSERLISFL